MLVVGPPTQPTLQARHGHGPWHRAYALPAYGLTLGLGLYLVKPNGNASRVISVSWYHEPRRGECPSNYANATKGTMSINANVTKRVSV